MTARGGDARRPALRLALLGYGRMGRLIEELAPAHGCEVALRLASADNPDGAGLTPEALAGIDVAIDFSAAAAVPGHVERLAALGVPMVVGTTGWLAELPRVCRAVERRAARWSTAPTSRSGCRSSSGWWRPPAGCSPPTPPTRPGRTRSTTAASRTLPPALCSQLARRP